MARPLISEIWSALISSLYHIYIYTSISLSIYLCPSVFIYLSIYLSIYPFIYLSLSLNLYIYIYISFECAMKSLILAL